MCDSLYGMYDKHVFWIVSFVSGHTFMSLTLVVLGRFLISVPMANVLLKGNIYLVGKNSKERTRVHVNKLKSYELMTERIECLYHLPVKWNDCKKMDLYVVKDEQLFIIL